MNPERIAAIRKLLPAHDLPALFQLRDSIAIVQAYCIGQMAAPGLVELGKLVDNEIQNRKGYQVARKDGAR